MSGAARAQDGSWLEAGGDRGERRQPAPRCELVSSGPEGDALVQEVALAADTLHRLLDHTALFPGRGKEIQAIVDTVEERLRRRELSVVVVGENGCGKTTFLDALIGNREVGIARGKSPLLTLLRRAPKPNYRAQLKDGKVEDFSRRFADRSAELEKSLADASARLLEVEQACAVAAHRVRDAQKRAARAKGKLERRLSERTRSESAANDASQRVLIAAEEAERAQAALVLAESSLPTPLRSVPAWWAFWLWMLRALLLFLKRREWRAYWLDKHDYDAKQAQKAALERDAAEAAEACAKAGSGLDALAAEVETLGAELAAASAEPPRLEREREAARRDVERANTDLSHHREERLRRFHAELRALSDVTGRGRDLTELVIEYPARLLPDDVAIIDAPAVTSGVFEQEERALGMIRERADGCILLSELDAAVGSATARFLQRLKDVVPHILLVLTKVDRAYVQARRRGAEDAWEQVENARRLGTRRFAHEIGRSPETVLSLSVAAEAALDDESSGLSRRFEEEAEKLFQLLRHERLLILGTRSANAVQALIAQMAEAKPRVARAYEQKIAALRASRSPEPDSFRAQALEAAESRIAAAAREATLGASRTFSERFSATRTECIDRQQNATSSAELVAAATRSEKDIDAGIAQAKAEARAELERAIDRSVREIEGHVFEQLRQCYRLAHEIHRSEASLVDTALAIEPTPRAVSLAPDVKAAVSANTRVRIALGAGGAVTLSAIGFLAAGPVAALVGGLLGSFVALARTRTALVKRAQSDLARTLDAEARAALDELESHRPSVEASIRSALEASVERAMLRHESAIAEPIEAERQAIERAEWNLAELDELAGALDDHHTLLDQLMKAAQEASMGLCR